MCNGIINPGLYLLESGSDCDGYIVSLKFKELNFNIILPGSNENYILNEFCQINKLECRNIDNFDIIEKEDQFHWPFTHWWKK